ncbi:MAG: hypothetical protein ACPGU7_13050 [Gammaproteobacteria bacterium]
MGFAPLTPTYGYSRFSRDDHDALRYGFVSAGGGRWDSRTLETLNPGARIFLCIPGTGYVGVGKVVGSASPVTEFQVQINGLDWPVLDAPLYAKGMGERKDDPEAREHLVPVEWFATHPIAEACWEKGMYANQNTVTKLRNRFTLERLVRHFELED